MQEVHNRAGFLQLIAYNPCIGCWDLSSSNGPMTSSGWIELHIQLLNTCRLPSYLYKQWNRLSNPANKRPPIKLPQTEVAQAKQLLSEVNGVSAAVQDESNVTAVTAEMLQSGSAWVTRGKTLTFQTSEIL